jgi:thioredoxin reductase (NADPH)
VGGGDTDMEEAIFLTKFADRVRVVHRRDALRASRFMAERAEKNPKIGFLWNRVITEVLGDDKVTGVRLKDTTSDAEAEEKTDGVFMAIGHIPNTGAFEGQLEMDPKGYIVVQGRSTATSVPGVFAAGDVADPTYRQAVSAAGTGCMAALDAERFLEQED